MSVPPDKVHRHGMYDAIFRLTGLWTPTRLYDQGDTVIAGNIVYVCLEGQQNHGHVPKDSPTVWQPLGSNTTRDLIVVIDGGGAAITTGVKGDVRIDFDCTILNWTLLADLTGSIQVDIWKKAYSGYPPTVVNTITSASPPTLSAANHNTNSTLSGWTKTISAGETLRFNVDSASAITRVTLILKITG